MQIKGEKMKKFANFIVKGRYFFLGLFFVLAVVAGVLTNFVSVNYDLTSYLPNNSSTKTSIEKMTEEFGANGTASIMLENVNSDRVENIIVEIKDLDGVSTAIKSKEQTTEDGKYYALISIFLKDGDYSEEAETVLNNLQTLMSEQLQDGQNYYLVGSATNAIASRTAISNEMPIILLIAVAIVLLVLLLTTRSWIEPVILLVVIGMAILINMGTNYFLGSISFISNSISSVLLIALAMDYSIVLVSRFREERDKTDDIYLAMKNALAGSLTTIIASGLTVMAGLLSLVFMSYRIGMDMGLVLTKGVFISVLAVMFLMPAILLLFAKLLKKTEHKNFLPGLKKIGTFSKKTRFVFPVIFLVLVCGGYAIKSTMLEYSYTSTNGETTQAYKDSQKVDEVFGVQNTLVLMLDKNVSVQEQENIYDHIKEQKIINSSNSFYSSGDKVQNKKNGEYDTLALGDAFNADKITSYIGTDTDTANMIIKYLNGGDETKTVFAYQVADFLLSDLSAEDVKNIFGIDNTVIISETTHATLAQTLVYSNAEENSTTAKAYKIVASITKLDASTISAMFGIDTTTANAIIASINSDDTTKVAVYTYQFVSYVKTSTAFTDEQKTAINTAISKQSEQNDTMMKDLSEKLDLAKSLFISENTYRMLFNINAEVESEEAENFVKELNTYLEQEASQNGNFNYYIVNNTQNSIETKELFQTDRTVVDLVAAIAILIIVMAAFRSVSIPVLLVLVIEGSIWINLAGNALLGNSIFFICYLLGTAIQMGATIDYGILLTDRYVEARRTQNKFEAIKTAIDKSFTTLITSGSILVLAACTIGLVSSYPLISSIGYLVSVGALCATLSILFVLPQTLLIFDKVIEKTTLHAHFVSSKEELPTTSATEKIDVENVADKEQKTETTEENTEEAQNKVESKTKKPAVKTSKKQPVKTAKTKVDEKKVETKPATKKATPKPKTSTKKATTSKPKTSTAKTKTTKSAESSAKTQQKSVTKKSTTKKSSTKSEN